MLRAVLDTNVIVSGTISSSGTPFEVLEAWRHRRFTLVTSPVILGEAERVFEYPRIKKAYGLDAEIVDQIVARFTKYAIVTPGELAVREIEDDPADDMFLACAIEGEADFIVTGDRHLLGVGSYRSVSIMGPRSFLIRLEQRSGRGVEAGE
jgi:putative PIN family toxin of toxin-antitoxin system